MSITAADLGSADLKAGSDPTRGPGLSPRRMQGVADLSAAHRISLVLWQDRVLDSLQIGLSMAEDKGLWKDFATAVERKFETRVAPRSRAGNSIPPAGQRWL